MKLNTVALAASCILTVSAKTGPAQAGVHSRLNGSPTKMEDFKWSDPFSSRKMKKFAPACDAEQTFKAREYLLDDLTVKPPKGISPWADALKKIFSGRQYPGSWDGIDPHGYDRNLLMMEYSDVPIPVREWIEDQERNDGEGKGLFAVYEKPKGEDDKIKNVVKFPSKGMAPALRPLDQKKVVLFAPGAVYDILPLWVADDSDCKDTLLDTSKYSPKLGEGGVVAWPVKHTAANRKKDERDMEFTVRAQVLKVKAEEAAEEAAEEGKDEL